MADHEELEFTTTKRARWSSESSCEQNHGSSDCNSTEETKDSFLLGLFGSDPSVSFENISSATTSREQYGGLTSHERLESDDFPTCFSVEDDVDNLDEHHFQPIAGPMGWIQRQMSLGINPEDILAYMVPHAQVPSSIDKTTLWKIIIDILTEPHPRQKLDHINSLDDVVELLQGSKNIVVLTGAGVSVSCGIPDFRSRDGVYAKLSVEYPDLPDPQAMFDIEYFCQNPRPFFKFAKEIYPGQFQPSLSHQFIKNLESKGQLLKNYSQNIDTLEQIAGITRVIQCHGSFSTASCTNCKHQVSCEAIREDIFRQIIPLCPKCPQDGSCFAIMKPDIVFFGESLPSEFYHNLDNDSDKTDLLIVIGSSLKVRPVALIPSHIPPEVPQILINREPLRHMRFDVELLGDCDVIISELCQRLGGDWNTLLDGRPEIPCLEKRPVTVEEQGAFAVENPKVKSDELARYGSDQMSESALSTEASASSRTSPSPDPSRSIVERCVTLGESSGCGETGDNSSRDQPRAFVHDQGNESFIENETESGDSPKFLFLPPSRYIFYGAEVMDSPLPSPQRNVPGYPNSSSEESDSDSLGEIDDSEATSCDQLYGVFQDLMSQERKRFGRCEQDGYKLSNRQTTENNPGLAINTTSSENNSDDGFGEGDGDVDKWLEPTGNSESTSQALSLILGGLSNYRCGSEENSRLSGSDDPVTVGSSLTSDLDFPSSKEVLFADRPFSAITMDTALVKQVFQGPEHQDQLEEASKGNDVTTRVGSNAASDSFQL
ncbi:NAD-dependent protein deacetylase sirtuin-1-like [Montipora foliosa]|uniref:NAD-dependent protein deacetylase sirtuin-1-like n=1 Tax=Montipora foliosa TaxID=591990 RepID=UPI0035F103A9